MREATQEERKGVNDYIESISRPTGVTFSGQKIILIEMLQEIRQEIEERINNCGDGNFKDGLCEAFDIVYCKIKELNEWQNY